MCLEGLKLELWFGIVKFFETQFAENLILNMKWPSNQTHLENQSYPIALRKTQFEKKVFLKNIKNLSSKTSFNLGLGYISVSFHTSIHCKISKKTSQKQTAQNLHFNEKHFLSFPMKIVFN